MKLLQCRSGKGKKNTWRIQKNAVNLRTAVPAEASFVKLGLLFNWYETDDGCLLMVPEGHEDFKE